MVEKCRRWHAQFDVCLVSNNQNETHHRDTMAYSSTKGGKVLLMCHTAAKTQCDSEPVNQLSKLSFWPRCIYGFHVYSPTAHWSYSPLVLQPTGPTIRHLQYSVLFQYYLNMKMYLIHMKLIKLGIQGRYYKVNQSGKLGYFIII